MSMKEFEERILSRPGAHRRVAETEDELRLAAGLTALREQAGLSQRDVAKLIGVSQPRIVAIEHSRNVTIEVLDQYVNAVGGTLEVNVVKGKSKIALIGKPPKKAAKPSQRANRSVKSA
jgi:transcriptional regulator with XRE-family HTH domain